MVANVFNTFCSVTVQCARCHDHKADPWTQEHYYALQSVFAAIDRADRPYDTDPEIARRRHELDRDIRAARHEMAGIEVEIHKAIGPRLAEMEVEIAGLAAPDASERHPAPLVPQRVGYDLT